MSAPADPVDQAPQTVRRFLLTVEEAARALSVSPKTVRRWIDSAELPSVRFGRLVRIAEADLAAFVERHRKS